MPTYLIKSAHDSKQCIRALDEELAKGPDVLDQFVYGCHDGDHTGYAIVEAASKEDAMSLVPDMLQPNAVITQVDKYNADDIRALHAA